MYSYNSGIKSAARASAGAVREDSIDSLLYKIKNIASDLWESSIYFPALLGIAAMFLLSGNALEGCIFMALFTSFMLVFCSDALSALLPILLLCLLTTDYYSRYNYLISHWWAVALIVLSLIIHFIMYTRRTLCIKGYFTNSLTAVAAAAILGGAGIISAEEYFSAVSLYYVFGTGIAMLFTYIFVKSELQKKRKYKLAVRFAGVIYTAGMFAGIVILTAYIRNVQEFIQSFSALNLVYRNFAATFLLVALPMPCIFIKYKKSHFGGLAFMYVMLLMTGSRSGLIFGTISLLGCLIYIYISDKKSRPLYRKLIIYISLPVAACIYVFSKALFTSRMTGGVLISPTENRMDFVSQGIADFFSNPLFGCGLGNTKNSYIYLGVPGSIVWYHNIIVQVFASLGVFGAAAYAVSAFLRLKLCLAKMNLYTLAFILSYAGMVMVSMTNPGEMCPFPNAFLMVIMFAVIETFKDRKKPKLKKSE